MDSNPLCSQWQEANTYTDTISWFCADCGHEWNDNDLSSDADEPTVRDANGTVLNDGNTVTLIKDLKVRGTSSVLKVGTKIKNIRIVDGDHDIDCKTEIGPMMLKSEFLKKILK
jgi:protein PhnA